MKILIVDDELVSRKTLQKFLSEIGECDAVENGEDALKIIMSENPPELVLLDIIMPGIDGYEVCSQMKANTATKEIPVIFLSANAKVEDITKGFDLGAVDYITKPFHKEEVKVRVRTHLSIKQMQNDLLDKNITLERQINEIQEKTEQLRQKDEQLIEMDRIAGLGTLAAGIAHEINNPLGFIKSSVGFLNKSLNKALETVKYWDDKPIPEELLKEYADYLDEINLDHVINSRERKYESILRGIDRIINIVNSLKRFSRVDMEAVGELDINQSITDASDILKSVEAESVHFIQEFQKVPFITCTVSEINQCLLHILKNSLDAVEQVGIIRLITEYDEKDKQIIVKIRDNGKGMSPEVLRQALNPFFTTKAVGSGTGVGLSMTETIIKRHGGTINIASKEGEGTEVTITLPIQNEGSEG